MKHTGIVSVSGMLVAALLFALQVAAPAYAREKTVTLEVTGMH